MGNIEFTAIYKTWTNQQLHQVLQKKEEYQSSAIEAASAELNSRELSPALLAELESEFQQLESEQSAKIQKQLGNQIELYKQKALLELDPFNISTIERRIRLFCYSIGIILAFNFFTAFKWISYVFRYSYWNGPTILDISTYFFVTVGIYYFWHRKKFGWCILTAWLLLSITSGLFSYINELQLPGDSILSYYKHGLLYYIIMFLFYGSMLFFINSKKIIEAFNISRKFQRQTIIIASSIIFIYFLSLFF